MALTEMLVDLPRRCDVGMKRDAKSRKINWICYKLHTDAATATFWPLHSDLGIGARQSDRHLPETFVHGFRNGQKPYAPYFHALFSLRELGKRGTSCPTCHRLEQNPLKFGFRCL